MTGGFDSFIQVWDVEHREMVKSIQLPDWIHQVRFGEDENELLIACRDGVGRRMEWRTETVLQTLFHEDEVTAIALAHEGDVILTGCRDHLVRVWDGSTGHQLTPSINFGAIPLQIDILDETNQFVVSGVASETEIHPLPVRHRDSWGQEELAAMAELVSGKTIRHGMLVEKLNSADWLQRWQSLGRRSLVGEEFGASQSAECHCYSRDSDYNE